MAMAGSGSQGKWEVLCVTEDDIQELKHAGYLPVDVVHYASEEGQVVPTPKTEERVVFIPHFIRGPSFLLHPFVRG